MPAFREQIPQVLRVKPDSTEKSFLSLEVPRFGDNQFEEAAIRKAKEDFETIVQQGILEILKLDEDLNGIAINWLQNFLKDCAHDLPPRGSTIAEHLQIFWQQRGSDPDGLFAACVAALGVGGSTATPAFPRRQVDGRRGRRVRSLLYQPA